MPRKLFYTLLFLVFMGILPVGCCKEEVRDYANLRAMKLLLTEPGPGSSQLASGSRTTASELVTTIIPEYDFVTLAPAGALFTGSALAWSCDEPGEKGLKDKVAAVSFASTGLFNGIAAGQSLEPVVRCSGGLSRYKGLDFPLSQLADSLNTWKSGKYGDLNSPLELHISPKPRDNARQQFELRIRLESGKEVMQATPEIFWE